MKLTALVAQHIREVYEGENWSDINLKDVLKDITWKEAVEDVPGLDNTIAMLLYHVHYYNEVVMERLRGNTPVINADNGFDAPGIENELDWEKLIQQAHESFLNLANAVENFPEDKLFEFVPGSKTFYYKVFHGIAEHAHYHLGEIVYLKKLLRHEYI